MITRLLLVVVIVALVGCGKEAAKPAVDDHKDHADEGAAKAAAGDQIAVPVEVRANLGIRFAKAESRVVVGTLRIPGHFEAEADARRAYAMPVAGAIEVLVTSFDPVAAGQPLYRVSGEGWARLRGQWQEAESAASAGSEALARRRDLIAATVAQMAGLPAGDARVAALRDAAALTVHARASGQAEAEVAVSGSFLREGDPVVAVTDATRVRFRATALQADLSRIREQAPAAIVPVDKTWSERIAVRIRLGLDADPAARTFAVLAWPTGEKSPRWARAGVAAILEVVTEGSGDAEIAIPLAATIRDGLQTVYFRRDPTNPDQVMRTIADLGANDGVWIQVLSGLGEGAEIVVEGTYPLMLSGGGKEAKAGHFHSDGTFHDKGH